MSRVGSDSISFVVQANFSEEDASVASSDFLHSPSNLVESSDKYGFIFFSRRSSLLAVSIQQTESLYDGGESSQPFDPDFSFKVDFSHGDINLLALSPTESFIAVISGRILTILSVSNLLITVRHRFLIHSTELLNTHSKPFPFFFKKRSRAESVIRIVDLEPSFKVPDFQHKFQAAWSCCLDNEQLAVVLPNEILFVLPKVDQQSALESINKAYSCVTWSPSKSSEKVYLLAAVNNCIDVINGRSGKLITSFNEITQSEEDETGK